MKFNNINIKKELIMESITVITTFVLFIFGVLQIILFFKIWGMTNDVRKLVNKGDVWDVRKAILIGDKEEIKKAVVNRIANVIIEKAKSGNLVNAQNIIKYYQSAIDKYEVNISDVMKEVKSASDIKDLIIY
jgi:Na+-transporting methylmalonyl-CoA/oxaloacetate decarboxylase gamma subunit